MQKPQEKPRFVIRFFRAQDIAPPENRSKCDPFLRAFLSAPIHYIDEHLQDKIRIERISSTVITPKRTDCTDAIWDCYRDFRMNPPANSILTVEVLNPPSDNSKPDILLGKVDIPISALADGDLQKFDVISFQVNQQIINIHYC